jgi:hypothetical protein
VSTSRSRRQALGELAREDRPAPRRRPPSRDGTRRRVDVDVEVPGVLVEVKERSGALRDRTPLALAQRREPAKLCQEWIHPIEVFLSRMPHLPSMTLSAQAPVAATPDGPDSNALSQGASQRISSTARAVDLRCWAPYRR